MVPPQHWATAQQLPTAFSHSVPGITQAFNWDCGLACVLMVLKALGFRHYHMATLMQKCPTRSIWTIDLAHLLAACGVSGVQLLTITVGANQAYSDEHFYAESILADSRRVRHLFETAAAAGILVEQRSVTLPDLIALLLAGSHLLIVLVNKVTLGLGPCHGKGQDACSSASRTSSSSSCAAGVCDALAARGSSSREHTAAGLASDRGYGAEAAAGGRYLGHYIVVCGYDASRDAFDVRDPARSGSGSGWVPAARLEAARKCFGTDEDLLIVPVPPTDAAAKDADADAAARSNALAAAEGAAACEQRHQQQNALSQRS